MTNAESIKKEGLPVFAQWQAPEFEKYKKDSAWFLWAALAGLGLFAISLLMHNFVFAFLIVLIVLTIFIYARKEPNLINFKIDGQGIWIEEKLHEFNEIKSFWIFCRAPFKELSLHSQKRLLPFIKIPLGEKDCSEIRELLIKFLPEEKQEESILNNLSRFLKF
ncbi:MAG: hypothetical protein PHQ47_01650 [Candidatus Portnoybacteria bacterium]|nr:hypothetical protein [Candidatus Portnoybacteria bacterium]